MELIGHVIYDGKISDVLGVMREAHDVLGRRVDRGGVGWSLKR